MSKSNGIIRPTLHHYGLTTANLEAMSSWYATVLGMTVVFETSSALGEDAPIKVRAAWVTNDAANHRIGLIAIPELTKVRKRALTLDCNTLLMNSLLLTIFSTHTYG